ncbi:hypothetical protein AAFF_G00328460 [Aldrovandia affinis]|uniref:Ermin n=1 Tax=Aldrovandia affinis TaxID=143900 RepID=A0AAD7X1R4_9TELE|nr:hypothetical protein AAFF_G00328460 [Aldrovandia affinis]
MAERSDATLLPLGGSAITTQVVEIIAGVDEIQSLVDAVEAATDALEKDNKEEVIFHNQEDMLPGPGINEEGRRAHCPAKALLAPGPNDVGITEAVTQASSDPSPLQLKTKVSHHANNGRVDPLVDPAYLSGNGTPLNLVHSEPRTEPREVPKPIAQNPGETKAESSAGSPELEVDRNKASVSREKVPLMEQTAQEVTQLAIPGSEKDRAQVNREEEAPVEGPNEELLSESHDELEEEEEDAADRVQQEITCMSSQGSGGASQMSSSQSSREMPSQKSSISCHSYSKYNTVSYRKIRKGNTKQRIDEFESMMHL